MKRVGPNGLPTLANLVEKSLGRLFKSTLGFSVFLLVVGGLSYGVFVLRPTINDLHAMQKETKEALQRRNQELVRFSVEQAAGNITKILTSAENAVTDMTAKMNNLTLRGVPQERLPVEDEFQAGGKLQNLLASEPEYPNPVALETPLVRLRDSSELKLLKGIWKPFFYSASQAHFLSPELKWLYLGTKKGNFITYPASGTRLDGYDPRTRPWFSKATQENKVSWVAPYVTAAGQDLVLTVAAPVSKSAMLAGAVVGIDVTMSEIINNLLSTPYCEKCSFYIINEKREVIGKRGYEPTKGNASANGSAPLFIEELLTITSPEISKSLVDRIYLNDSPLNRRGRYTEMPKAKVISAAKDPVILMSAPINYFGWKLIGVLPRGYVGTDGEAAIAGVDSLVSAGQTQVLIMYIFVVAFILSLIYIMFRIARFSVQRILSPALNKISDLAENVSSMDIDDAVAIKQEKYKNADTHEYQKIVNALNQLSENLKSQVQQRENLKIRAELGNLAAQVAHDIKSPLAALSALESSLGDLPEDIRILTRKAITRIRDIANNLLTQNRISQQIKIDEHGRPVIEHVDVESINAYLAIESTISEARQKFMAQKNVEIEVKSESQTCTSFVKANLIEFQRLISNLIDNAVEASGEKAHVQVVLKKKDSSKLEIKVIDNGKGIPAHVIPSLGTFGSSFGKLRGNGMGLFHAKHHIEVWSGAFSIDSEEGVGTIISMVMPLSPAPAWFCEEIVIPADGGYILVLDDDESVHAIWQKRFGQLGLTHRVVHFHKSDELRVWLRDNPEAAKNMLLLCDFELHMEKTNGIRIIAEEKVADRAILVTSRSEEEKIIRESQKYGIRILPKILAPIVEIKDPSALSSIELALIDDDELMRQAWILGGNHRNKKVACFANVDEFYRANVAVNTPVYIDLHLGSQSGLDVAAALHNKGYSKINLATGDENVEGVPHYIQSVCGKDFPA